MRDIIAHKKMEFDETNNFSSFRVLYVDENNGEEVIFESTFTIQEIRDFITRFANINLSLAYLVQRLRNGE